LCTRFCEKNASSLALLILELAHRVHGSLKVAPRKNLRFLGLRPRNRIFGMRGIMGFLPTVQTSMHLHPQVGEGPALGGCLSKTEDRG
jgi:hypothetical protein